MIKKTTISLLTIFFALNTVVVLAAGSNPNGIAPENQSETMPPSNNAPKGTMEAVIGNDADTNTTTTQTITTQSETTNTNTTQKQQSNALKRKGMVCTKAKEHHLLATYDNNQNCIVKTCVAGYEVSDNKCIKKTNKDNSNTSPSSQNGTNSTDEYESAKETEQSKANRLLTSASSAATGIGGMELMQGLSEQKADRAAEQSMSAYIATMRCSYGNGKQVKAGTEEIELTGGNDGNIMKYRSEYVALAADLKERKTALGLKPGIESEEILDKSQMGLYDDENIGISDGAYASLYRAQMLGSEKDQEQIDDAKQTSKTRVIGGAVAAGVGVVGGIVGDELINQSLSSSTKTAQTCTESGGTWQGARCHCPDGFIQHTKTGPCFEEKQDQETPENTPLPGQSSSSLNSNDNSDANVNDGNGSGGTDNYNSDSNSGNGGNNPSASADNEDTKVISEKPKIAGQQIVAVAPNGNNYKWDEINQDGSPKSSPAPKIQSDNTNNDEDEKDKSNANKDNKVDDKNNSIDVNVSAAQDGDSGTISTATANPNNGNNTSNSNVNPSNAGGSNDSFTETDNSAKTPAAPEQRKVTERSQTKSTPSRANTTNNKTQTSKQSSSNGKKDLKYIYGTFEDAQVTKSQAEQLVKLWAEHTGIKGLTCDKEIRGNIELVCSNSNTDYHFIFEDLTESFPRTQKKSIAMTVCKIFGGKKQTDLDTGLASRIHCEINTNVCNNQLNSALKRFGQKSYMYNVYSSTGNGATKTLSRTYCTIEW